VSAGTNKIKKEHVQLDSATATANAIHQADIESFSSLRGDGKSSGTRGKLNNDSIYRGDI